MSIVKRQHYVWRYYLRPWAKKEKIITFFKQSGKVEQTGLMNVAQEKYFYKLIDLTNDEENFLRRYIENNSPEVVKGLNLDFLNLFTTTTKLKMLLERTVDTSIDKEKFGQEINKLELNLMEQIHGQMEALGKSLVNCRNLADLHKIGEGEALFESIMFICFQYFRTKNMKKSVIDSFKGGPLEKFAEKSWNILCYSTATTVASNISIDKCLKFILIENNTDLSFITSDQPVFNILNDQVNEKGEAIKLEFYYPISPKHALRINLNRQQGDKFESIIADDEMVVYLNKKTFENADFFVFSDTFNQLKRWQNK